MAYRILLPALVLSLVVFFMHTVALGNFFYWKYWWYDIVVHTLTGVAVGLVFSHIMFRLKPDMSTERVAMIVFSALFLIAFGWEVFEYLMEFIVDQKSYLLDTIIDFAVALVGAGVSIVYSGLAVGKSLWRKEESPS